MVITCTIAVIAQSIYTTRAAGPIYEISVWLQSTCMNQFKFCNSSTSSNRYHYYVTSSANAVNFHTYFLAPQPLHALTFYQEKIWPIRIPTPRNSKVDIGSPYERDFPFTQKNSFSSIGLFLLPINHLFQQLLYRTREPIYQSSIYAIQIFTFNITSIITGLLMPLTNYYFASSITVHKPFKRHLITQIVAYDITLLTKTTLLTY